jgi:hypothetical protein
MSKLQRDNDAPGKVHHTAGGLPERCWSTLPSDPDQVILIKRGVIGYCPIVNTGLSVESTLTALNEGLTSAQLQAMKAGSMFGWDVPGADPANYDESGKPLLVKSEEPAPQFPTQLLIDSEERDTILAALRLWQHHLDGTTPDFYGLEEIRTNGDEHEGLDSDAIDELCERING